jgi:phosphopantothenoylcysteine decarboxylase/phosphopantothenate--cysteine ligase
MNLKNKRVLITAGPTWVPIDSVRVISNIASGETGILLAEKLIKKQAKVTLVLGPVGGFRIDRRIHLIKFRFFEELRARLKKELSSKNYDIVIHSAAVSDFKPEQPVKGKLKSGKTYGLRLTPLPKITGDIRRFAHPAKLVLFKLEAGISDNLLLERAKAALADYGADLIVANRIMPQYRAYILGWKKIYSRVASKEKLAQALVECLALLT